ncbi:MAG: hypothetical protein IPJ65_13605 [Archangiaceae bacterium]|nr:hypothetical protein [Archangiaceae bacterium]
MTSHSKPSNDTTNTAAGSSKPTEMLVGCGVCGARITILSPPSDRFVDPKDGREYSMAELPRHDDGRAILVCVDCLRSAVVLIDAGHSLDFDCLRVTKSLLIDHECEADEGLDAEGLARERDRRLVEFYEQLARNGARVKRSARH